MNTKHGPMTFFGIEIPVNVVYDIKKSYHDKCGHSHKNNIKKAKYEYCEKCGTARYYIEKKLSEIGQRIYDRLIFTEIEDSEGNVVQKYYAVMEWYRYDVKINFTEYNENLDKRNQFKALLKDVKLWRAKRFGLYQLNNVIPTVSFYKNKSLENNCYATSALEIDDELENVHIKQDDTEIIDKTNPA